MGAKVAGGSRLHPMACAVPKDGPVSRMGSQGDFLTPWPVTFTSEEADFYTAEGWLQRFYLVGLPSLRGMRNLLVTGLKPARQGSTN
jgi:hypothetical protein